MNNGQEKGAVKNLTFVIIFINDHLLQYRGPKAFHLWKRFLPDSASACHLINRLLDSPHRPSGTYTWPHPQVVWLWPLQLAMSGGFHLFLLGELSKLGVISPARWFLWTVAPLRRVEELLVSLGSFRDTFPLSFLTVNIVKHLDPHYQAREYWCRRWKCFPENHRPGGNVIQTIVLH